MSDSGDRLVRGIKWAIVLMICLPILVAVIAFASWRSTLAREVNRKLQAIKTAGLPSNGEELNQWYASVPDSDNAALVMTQAFSLLVKFDDARSNVIASFKPPPRSQAPSADERKLLADYVRLNNAALAKAHEALALPQSRYPVDTRFGNYTLLPHLAKIRELARLEDYQGLLQTCEGRPSEAAAATRNILGFARTLEEEPLLVSQLVRVACLSIARGSLERTLNATALDTNALQKLARSFDSAHATNRMARALIGERAMYAPMFRMSWANIRQLVNVDSPESADASAPPVPGKSPWFLRATGFLERDLNFYLGAMQTNIDFALKSAPENLQITNLSPKIEQEAVRKKYILSAMTLPALSRVILREAESEAHVRLACTAIAIEQFRSANKKLPASLEDLAPKYLGAIPLDPFTGQPLRFKQLPRGYVVYSLDKDGRDDGGKEKPANRKTSDRSTYDLTFTVER
jgi:hypothetical protein